MKEHSGEEVPYEVKVVHSPYTDILEEGLLLVKNSIFLLAKQVYAYPFQN